MPETDSAMILKMSDGEVKGDSECVEGRKGCV
jgi:hypothetical protein